MDDSLSDLQPIEINNKDETIKIPEDEQKYEILEDENNKSDQSGYVIFGNGPIIFTHNDLLLIILITFLSFLSRNFRLQYPNSCVFDEVHFGIFTNRYIFGEMYGDIHPPLARILMFAFAKLNQYNGSLAFQNGQNNAPYEDIQYIFLRQTPALFSSFCAPMIFIAMKCFRFSTRASFTASLMIICDTSMIVEGRFILTDGILHFFTCLAIMATGISISQVPYTGSWWIALIFNGFAIGCAISSKYTSLSLLPFLGFVHGVQLLEIHQDFFALLFKTKKIKLTFLIDLMIRAIVLILIIFLVWFTSFAIHLMLLPYRGTNNWVGPHYTQALLNKHGTKNWTKRTEHQSMLKNVISLNKNMHHNNMLMLSPHPYSSKWYTWPFLTGRWVLFYAYQGKHIMCMGQVFNVYTGTLSVIFVVLYGMLCLIPTKITKISNDIKFKWAIPALFVFGYCSSLFPFVLIKRTTFFYHYIISLIFGIIVYCMVIDILFKNHKVIKGFIFTLSQVLTIVALIFWSPWVYGYYIKNFNVRLWTVKWQR